MEDKCVVCNKKLLVIFKCKCDLNFCIKHRMPEDHFCKFDFIKYQKEKLQLENPIIQKNKIQKI